MRAWLAELHVIGDGLTADFLNGHDVQLALRQADSLQLGANFVSLFMNRVRLSSQTKTDGPPAMARSINFVAKENAGGNTAYDATSLVMEDSLA